MAADPIHQFQINKIFTIGHIGGQEIAFTNSSLFMVIAVGMRTHRTRGLDLFAPAVRRDA